LGNGGEGGCAAVAVAVAAAVVAVAVAVAGVCWLKGGCVQVGEGEGRERAGARTAERKITRQREFIACLVQGWVCFVDVVVVVVGGSFFVTMACNGTAAVVAVVVAVTIVAKQSKAQHSSLSSNSAERVGRSMLITTTKAETGELLRLWWMGLGWANKINRQQQQQQ
jgi:uncharacterized membrane protein